MRFVEVLIIIFFVFLAVALAHAFHDACVSETLNKNECTEFLDGLDE